MDHDGARGMEGGGRVDAASRIGVNFFFPCGFLTSPPPLQLKLTERPNAHDSCAPIARAPRLDANATARKRRRQELLERSARFALPPPGQSDGTIPIGRIPSPVPVPRILPRLLRGGRENCECGEVHVGYEWGAATFTFFGNHRGNAVSLPVLPH